MSDDFLVPLQDASANWEASAKKTIKVLKDVPTGQVMMLRDGLIEPLCSLQDFRDAYTYLIGTIALWAVAHDSREPLWSCNTQYSHAGFRLVFSRRDIEDALGQPGCALLTLLALDCQARAGHALVYRCRDRAFLSSAFQRMGEICFDTDAYPLASLSKKARPALAALLTLSCEFALLERGSLWNEPLLNKLLDAIETSGHFICTKA